MTREDWLNEVAREMSPWFERLGHPLPEVRISIGFPSTGIRGKRIGECWYPSSVSDQVHEIFISPKLADEMTIAATLAHELVHTAAGPEAKHGPTFRTIAVKIGLEGKMTHTVPGEAFKCAVAPILQKVGPYPGGQLIAAVRSGPPKQTTRLLKAACGECGYTVRITRKWIDVALPVCPIHGEEMEIGGGGEEE